jgi:hypothetical protein
MWRINHQISVHKMADLIRITVRLPTTERDWLAQQAEENCTSLNSELIRALRDNRRKDERRRARKAGVPLPAGA